MTDVPASPPPPAAPLADQRQTAFIVYILMLVPVVVFVTHLVGVVMAYINRDTAPDWLKTHYTHQIRTFWIGLLYFALACLSCIILVGFVLVSAVIVWYIVRCALGLSHLSRAEPYPRPLSWVL